jgi:hypothetical protein
LREPNGSCIFRRTSSSGLLQTTAEQSKGSGGGGRILDTGVGADAVARARVRPTRQRRQKRKSLQTTETTSNTVRNDIARATAAPHPNADGPPADERAHAPL